MAGFTCDEKEWHLAITRNMSLWHHCLALPGYSQYKRLYGITVTQLQLSLTIQGIHTYIFVNAVNDEAYGRSVLKRISTPQKIQSLVKVYHRLARDVLKALEAAEHNLTPRTWSQFQEAYTKFCPSLMLTSKMGRVMILLILGVMPVGLGLGQIAELGLVGASGKIFPACLLMGKLKMFMTPV